MSLVSGAGAGAGASELCAMGDVVVLCGRTVLPVSGLGGSTRVGRLPLCSLFSMEIHVEAREFGAPEWEIRKIIGSDLEVDGLMWCDSFTVWTRRGCTRTTTHSQGGFFVFLFSKAILTIACHPGIFLQRNIDGTVYKPLEAIHHIWMDYSYQ